MVALAATNVTVTITNRLLNIGARGLDKIVSIIDIAFGDSALTYPSGGIPLPDKAQFGFKKVIDFCEIEQPADGFLYKYDRTNHKLMIRTQGAVTGTTGDSDSILVKNSSGSIGDASDAEGVINTTYDLGAMIEMPATVAPAATSLRLKFTGE